MRTLRRLSLGVLAVACLALALPARAAEVDKLVPDDSDVVQFVNVKQLVDSPLVKKLFLDKIKDFLKSQDEVQKRLDALGFDVTKDVESITTAVWDIQPAQDTPHFLTIVHGKFDMAKFQAQAEQESKDFGDVFKVEKDGDYTYYTITPPNGRDKQVILGLLDKSTIVVSMDKDAVLDSYARNAGKKTGKVKQELRSLIEKADAKQSGWFVAIANAWSKLPDQAVEAKKIFDKMESITGSLAVEKDVKLTVTFAAKSTDGAKELAEDLKSKLNEAKAEIARAAAFLKPLSVLVDVLGAMSVDADGSKVVLKSEVSDELIEKNIKD